MSVLETPEGGSELKLFLEKKYHALKWSLEEKAYQRTRKQREKMFKKCTFSFTAALLAMYRKSILGTYMDEFNLPQHQNKALNENKQGITKWDIQRYDKKHLKQFLSHNNIFEDHMKVLDDAVEKCEVIDLNYLKNITTRLELPSYYINLADAGLKQFRNVRILVLIGNNLRDLPGYRLPKGLLYLELYDNFITDVRNLVKRCPMYLIHLGLGRNKLSDESSLHLLAKSSRFTHLHNLDLSNNDICMLQRTMCAVSGLRSLTAMALEGNPCAITLMYKDIVFHYLPEIKYLDNVEILKPDRTEIDAFDDGGGQAQILFKCFRVMGLPRPPKDKKSIQTIHVEVGFPLLEPPHESVPEIPTAEDEHEKGRGKSKSSQTNLKGSKKGNMSKSDKSSKTSRKSKKTSPYKQVDEYDPIFEKNNFYFKSVRMPWNKIIEYPPILVEPPGGDLVIVRDTFRTAVNVRVVYLKVAIPKKKKNGKTKKEDKKNKDKKSRKSDTTETTTVTTEESQEIISKRTTLCSFYCELKEMNWSDETMDFYWADHKTMENNALRVQGCLKEIRYSGDVKMEKEQKHTKKSAASVVSMSAAKSYPLPKILTCQVGFGLTRHVPFQQIHKSVAQ